MSLALMTVSTSPSYVCECTFLYGGIGIGGIVVVIMTRNVEGENLR